MGREIIKIDNGIVEDGARRLLDECTDEQRIETVKRAATPVGRGARMALEGLWQARKLMRRPRPFEVSGEIAESQEVLHRFEQRLAVVATDAKETDPAAVEEWAEDTVELLEQSGLTRKIGGLTVWAMLSEESNHPMVTDRLTSKVWKLAGAFQAHGIDAAPVTGAITPTRTGFDDDLKPSTWWPAVSKRLSPLVPGAKREVADSGGVFVTEETYSEMLLRQGIISSDSSATFRDRSIAVLNQVGRRPDDNMFSTPPQLTEAA